MADAKYSKVASFYAGKSVFVTGGTGFVGTTLIEKLLNSCTELNKIYVLVRDKNEEQARERLTKLTSTPAFDRLRMNRCNVFTKMVPLLGDVTQKQLGLSNDAIKTLEEEVSIVFHLAATVNFNSSLQDALNINVDGTIEVVELCYRLKKLEALVHVSTAFSNSDRLEINEIVYQMPVTLEVARKIAALYSHDEEIINELIEKRPNTYTFSKAIAEEVVEKACNDIPVAIVRPSIVMASLKEPHPGWINSWSGSTGVFVGMSSGTLKVVKGRGNNVADLIPVDIVANLLIVVATQCNTNKSSQVKVYNCCTGKSNPITSNGATGVVLRVTKKYSLNDFPLPMIIFTPNLLVYNILNFILQIVPAFVIDLLSLILGRKAMQLKIQSKLRKVVEAVKFFLLNEWKFSDDNVRALYSSLSEEDKEIFNFDVNKINWETYLHNYILGVRKFMLNLKDNVHCASNYS